MSIRLSEHLSYKKLIKLTIPSILMLIVTSLYSIVDGFFVSNFVGKNEFAAINFIMPFLMVFGSLGFMLGTGGSALIAKTMGEGDDEKANKLFSMVIYSSLLIGIILSAIGLVFIRPFAKALGAEGELLENAVFYGKILLISTPLFILQFEFQCLFATANKPTLGLVITILAGLTNVVLDTLFVAVIPLGLFGAAFASAIGQFIGGALPIIYFSRKNTSLLSLTKPFFELKSFIKICSNGMSEMLSNISTSIVATLYNIQLLKYIGEDGISAYGVLMYVSLIFQSVFLGYSTGVAPVVSYQFGAKNQKELKNLKTKCLYIISISSLAMLISSLVFAKPLSKMFVGYDKALLDLTYHAFIIYSFSYLFFGFALFASSFFTALNDGKVSALISFLRTLVFQVICVLILPLVLKTEGIWLSVIIAEILSAVTAMIFIKAYQKKYGY